MRRILLAAALIAASSSIAGCRHDHAHGWGDHNPGRGDHHHHDGGGYHG